MILGFDIGSTGSKAVALDADTHRVIWQGYRNTNGQPVAAAQFRGLEGRTDRLDRSDRLGRVQLFTREARTFDEFDRLNDAHREANHWSNIYEASLFSIVEAISSISFALIVWYGGVRILAGTLAFGTLVAFIEYVQKFFVPIRDFSSKYAVMQSAMSAAERVFELLDTPTTPTFSPSTRPPRASTPRPSC